MSPLENTVSFIPNESVLPKPERDLTDTEKMAVSLQEFLIGIDIEKRYLLQKKIYQAYSQAMERRNREPLSEVSFDNHFFAGGNFEDSLILYLVMKRMATY